MLTGLWQWKVSKSYYLFLGPEMKQNIFKFFLQVQSWQKISEKTHRLLSFLVKQNYFFAFPTTVGYCLAVKHLKTSPSSSTNTLFFCIMELLG